MTDHGRHNVRTPTVLSDPFDGFRQRDWQTQRVQGNGRLTAIQSRPDQGG